MPAMMEMVFTKQTFKYYILSLGIYIYFFALTGNVLMGWVTVIIGMTYVKK